MTILLFISSFFLLAAQDQNPPLLTPDDFSPPQGTPILPQVFPGNKPAQGQWISGSVAAVSMGFSIGAAYYTLNKAGEDPFSAEVQQGAGLTVTGLICAGLSLVVMDYFRGIEEDGGVHGSSRRESTDVSGDDWGGVG